MLLAVATCQDAWFLIEINLIYSVILFMDDFICDLECSAHGPPLEGGLIQAFCWEDTKPILHAIGQTFKNNHNSYYYFYGE